MIYNSINKLHDINDMVKSLKDSFSILDNCARDFINNAFKGKQTSDENRRWPLLISFLLKVCRLAMSL